MPEKGVTFLKDEAGDWSMKRLYACGCLVVAVVIAFTTRDTGMVSTFLGSATLVLGVTAVTRT
jgi:hypothetical protein